MGWFLVMGFQLLYVGMGSRKRRKQKKNGQMLPSSSCYAHRWPKSLVHLSVISTLISETAPVASIPSKQQQQASLWKLSAPGRLVPKCFPTCRKPTTSFMLVISSHLISGQRTQATKNLPICAVPMTRERMAWDAQPRSLNAYAYDRLDRPSESVLVPIFGGIALHSTSRGCQ
ncbi:hypothetical protein F4814DRAFT_316576 [Daldinia grandis]|nr:hypothetical protein F4814DRAFT_316576 [Daldinia grandis]